MRDTKNDPVLRDLCALSGGALARLCGSDRYDAIEEYLGRAEKRLTHPAAPLFATRQDAIEWLASNNDPLPEALEETWTDAPTDYDGFGTRTLEVVGKTRRGPVRKVGTPPEHVTWQRQRYASGGVYLYASAAELPRVQSLIEPL